MKKILLATTAFASLVSASAFAEPSVKVGGTYVFEAGYVKQDSAFKAGFADSPNQKNTKFNNYANIFIDAKETADNGVSYGANLRIKGTASTNNQYTNGKTDRTYAWMESSMGRVEMGGNFAASKLLKVGAESIAKGTGGASNGRWTNYVNGITGSGAPQSLSSSNPGFVILGDNILASQSSLEEQVRITWISPRYAGLQFGLSYTPDMQKKADGTTVEDNFGILRQKNIASFGLNYTNAFDDINVSLSASYDASQRVKKNPNTNVDYSSVYNPLRSYSLGAAVGKGEFSAAASYGNDGKSGQLKDDGVSYKSRYWTAGTAYENGPFAGSITYFNSSKGKKSAPKDINTVSAYSLGLEYQVAAGFKPFAEVTRFSTKYGAAVTNTNLTPNASATKNKGYVVLIGSTVSF